MAECSESMGRSQASGLASGVARVRAAALAAQLRAPAASPGGHRRRASPCWRSPRPCRPAARPAPGRRLTMPPVATITRSTSSRVAKRSRASGRALQLRARRQVQTARGGSGRPSATTGGRKPRELGREGVRVTAGRQRHDPERVRPGGLEHVERLSADRSGRAEQRDPRRAPSGVASARRGGSSARTQERRTAAGAANRNESTRSRMPPWPGIRVPESLAPAARLSSDSATSPDWAVTAISRPSTTAHAAGPGRPPRSERAPTTIAATVPPMTPLQVLLGEMWFRKRPTLERPPDR